MLEEWSLPLILQSVTSIAQLKRCLGSLGSETSGEWPSHRSSGTELDIGGVVGVDSGFSPKAIVLLERYGKWSPIH